MNNLFFQDLLFIQLRPNPNPLLSQSFIFSLLSICYERKIWMAQRINNFFFKIYYLSNPNPTPQLWPWKRNDVINYPGHSIFRPQQGLRSEKKNEWLRELNWIIDLFRRVGVGVGVGVGVRYACFRLLSLYNHSQSLNWPISFILLKFQGWYGGGLFEI